METTTVSSDAQANSTTIDLSSAGDGKTETQAAILHSIKSVLEEAGSGLETETVDRLRDSIRDGSFSSTALDDGATQYAYDLWQVMIDVVKRIPADHLWQDAIAAALQRLQKWGGSIGKVDEDEALEWKDLPELGQQLRDVWFDPTTLESYTTEEVEMWKNLNSFVARLTTPTFAPWWNFPIWAIRSALEEEIPPPAGAKEGEKAADKASVPLESNLWIATEWLLRPSGIVVFEEMASPEPLDQVSSRVIQPGALCRELPSRSPKRLAFWKTRLLEFADHKQALGLSADLVDRLVRSAEAITKFENSHPVAAEEEAAKE